MSTPSLAIEPTVRPEVTAFFDAATNTVSYIVKDPTSSSCAIVDSVLDIDYAAGRTRHDSADRILAYVREHGLSVEWHIETHVHADHLSAAPYLQALTGGQIAIGEQITVVQKTFAPIFGEGMDFKRDGSQFHHLFKDGESYRIGSMEAVAILTPGHTPACMTHLIGDAAFVGDTLFMPDGGTARADFPGGDARTLYRSVKRILALSGDTRLFMCHDYAPNGRGIEWETTVAAQRAGNIHVNDSISEEQFVRTREARDATLDMPKLIIPSLQVNMKAGVLPAPDEAGRRFLKVPLNAL
jgi:glyoxylase-like metal-dependent hydrolase (beta-lactamase superfamily II)